MYTVQHLQDHGYIIISSVHVWASVLRQFMIGFCDTHLSMRSTINYKIHLRYKSMNF